MYCDGGAWLSMGGPVGNTTSGLIGWWKFDEGSGTSAADSSGNGNTGTLSGSTLPTWTTSGILNDALQFDGVTGSQNVTISTAALLGTGAATVSAWVYMIGPGAGGNNGVFTENGGALMLSDNNKWFFSNDGGTTQVTSAAGSVEDNQWQLVTVARNSSGQVTFYINGVQSGTANQNAGPTNSTSTHSAIGNCCGGYIFKGTIDDVRVYNRALSAADALVLYNSAAPPADTTTGLAGYWKLDDGSGTTATDSATTPHNGTLTNSPTWTTTGRVNGALTFNGTNNYVTMGNVTAFNGLTALTVSAWVKSSAAGANTAEAHFADKSACHGITNDGPFELGAGLDTSELPSFYVYPAGGSPSSTVNVVGTTNVDDGNWHFVLGEYDGATVSIWVDGSKQASTALAGATLSTSSHVMDIAGYCDGHSYFWSGTIDDVRVYTRALSTTDIKALYQSTAGACASPAGYTGDFIYNSASHVYQFCNASNWIPMGPVPGAGGGGCSSPAGSEGTFVYNADNHVMQYCDGANWVAAGENVPISGLVGWWNFDEGSGTSLADSSGYGNTGTLCSNAACTAHSTTGFWVAGQYGDAGNFNGTSQYVDVANQTPFNFDRTNAFTLAAWIYRNSSSDTDDEIFAKQAQSGAPIGYSLYMVNNGGLVDGLYTCTSNCIVFETGAPDGNDFNNFTPNSPAAPGGWHHVVMTYDGSSNPSGVKIYVDGVSQTVNTSASATMTGNMTVAQDLLIGQDVRSDSDWFGGKIDDARIYNRALSASEVWRLYNGAP